MKGEYKFNKTKISKVKIQDYNHKVVNPGEAIFDKMILKGDADIVIIDNIIDDIINERRGKKTSCDYGPNSRTIKTIMLKPKVFSADAIYFLLRRKVSHDYLNIGTGEDISIKNLAYMIKKTMNY